MICRDDEIAQAFKGADMVFVTCGMGGGTGTGAAPVIAEAARKANKLTVGVVTIPFRDEGEEALERAVEGIKDLKRPSAQRTKEWRSSSRKTALS